MANIVDYYNALDRIIKGCPINIPVGSRINNDNVAIEAGRKKGAIKNKRGPFKALIDDIRRAGKEQRGSVTNEGKLRAAKGEVEKFRVLWEESLGRELSLARQVLELSLRVEGLERDRPLRVVK